VHRRGSGYCDFLVSFVLWLVRPVFSVVLIRLADVFKFSSPYLKKGSRVESGWSSARGGRS
jgi:hypothetical protein